MTTNQAQSPEIPHEVHLQYLRQTIDLAQESPPKPTNFRVGCVIVSFALESQSTPSPPVPSGTVLSTGYTLEIPTPETPNTHAEQVALHKLSASSTSSSSSSSSSSHTNTDTINLQDNPNQRQKPYVILYTSLEPCSQRLSGNIPCVQRIISTLSPSSPLSPSPSLPSRINKVIFGAKEPNTFIHDSKSCQILTSAGVQWEYIPDFEREILDVAMAGHQPPHSHSDAKEESNAVVDTSVKDSSTKSDKKSTGTDDNVSQTREEEKREREQQPRNPKKRMMEVPVEELGGQQR